MWYQVNAPLRIEQMWCNFLPSWWNRNYGVAFGEHIIFDPDYRTEVSLFLARTLAQRFPELQIGSPDPKPQVTQPNLDNATTPALAGCEIHYPADNYPWNMHLPEERIAGLQLPSDLTQVFPYNEIISQVSYLNRKLELDATPWLPTRGVLNDAALLQGTSLFSDLLTNPQRAKHVLDYSHQLLMRLMRLNKEELGYRGMVMIANCTAIMISPEMYKDLLLPYDLLIQQQTAAYGQEFGLHHCGVLDAYTSAYRAIPHIHFLETGSESNIRAALEAFPESSVQYIFSAKHMLHSKPARIHDTMEQIMDAARGCERRFRISAPDIEYGTPDENLLEIFACCRQF